MFHNENLLIGPNMRLTVFLAVAACTAAGAPKPEPVRIDHVGLVAPDIIGVTLSARHVEYGRQVPYVRQKVDVVSDSDIHRFVRREGKVIGTLVGKSGDLLCTMDEVIGKKLDTAWADDPASYRIHSKTDPRYQTSQPPLSVQRKSKPADLGMVGPYQFEAPTRDVVYLKLPTALQAGLDYAVIFSDPDLPAQRFTFDPASLRSEAVHQKRPVADRGDAVRDSDVRQFVAISERPISDIGDAVGKRKARYCNYKPYDPRQRHEHRGKCFHGLQRAGPNWSQKIQSATG